MILRYSRPRHFTAGWTNPLLPLAMNSRGLITIPSPPSFVRHSHQSKPVDRLESSVTSIVRQAVGNSSSLSREQISLAGRIVAVADVFDALTSDRPYREGLSAEEALEILNNNRDTHLDSQCLDAFINAYLKGKIKTQREQEHLESQD